MATFRAVPASTWGHCPQVLCFTTVWDTPGKGKVAKWSSAPASVLEGFDEICAVYGPRKPCKTRGKRQSCQIDPCLPPYERLLSSNPSLRGEKGAYQGKEKAGHGGNSSLRGKRAPLSRNSPSFPLERNFCLQRCLWHLLRELGSYVLAIS